MVAVRVLLTLLIVLCTSPLLAYTIYLKDGSQIISKEPYAIEGDRAIIRLQNGTRTSIAATEIDVRRTEEANDGKYGSAMVLEDGGRFTELPSEAPPQQRSSLSEILAKRKNGAANRDPIRRPLAKPEERSNELTNGAINFQTLPRTPFSNLELAAEVQRVFRAEGVEQILISQGTANERLLIDLTTNSEAAVFRGLEAAAGALLHARDLYPSASPVFEILLSTEHRELAGQFVMTRALAQTLADGDVDASTFFIDHVRF